MLAGYIDGELTDEERIAFEIELNNDPQLKAQLEEFMKLKHLTSNMKYADLPDEVWESYWASIYKKLERGIGWILFSVGAIALLSFGVITSLMNMYLDPQVTLFIKIAVTALTLGTVVLLVSFLRERLFAYKRERYSEVTK